MSFDETCNIKQNTVRICCLSYRCEVLSELVAGEPVYEIAVVQVNIGMGFISTVYKGRKNRNNQTFHIVSKNLKTLIVELTLYIY